MPATKKKTAPKPARKTASKPASKPAAKPAPKSKDHTVTTSALKLVDEAAALLRKGISTGSDTSEKAREEARKKAHGLLNKATSSLSDVLDGSASVLRKVINKL